MLNKIAMEHYGVHEKIDWTSLGRINLLLGSNGSGKTFLLKAIYAALKTLELYRRGNDNRTLGEVLSDKLYWTFQTERLGDLVQKNAEGVLSFLISEDDNSFSYEFGRDTIKKINKLHSDFLSPREETSIFVPAKEVLSLFQIILKSREQDRMFGFDDTYLDLVKALQIPAQRGRNYASFAKGKESLQGLLGGKVEYDKNSNKWYFKRGNTVFAIGTTSEGIKKLAIFNTLLSNHYLSSNSVIFIDEIESALHPSAISSFLDIIHELSKIGIQFFIATHSYFVIKKLALLAKQENESIPVLSLSTGAEPRYDNMRFGMPDNSIIDESVRLYEAEVDFSLGGTMNG